MKDLPDELRDAVNAALKADPPRFRSVNDLARKAGVDTAGLTKFLKAGPGESSKITFVFAAKLLEALGGGVSIPTDAGGGTPSPMEEEDTKLQTFISSIPRYAPILGAGVIGFLVKEAIAKATGKDGSD